MMDISLNEVWNQIVASLDERIDRHSLETWIQPVKPLEITDQAFTIGVPSKFFATWLEDHHADIIKQSLKEITRRDLELKFSILSTERPPEGPVTGSTSPVSARRKVEGANLNQKYTFEAFVVGGGNKFAHAAAMAVAERPARAYNPLFIYGGVGLGKTHIMQAIGSYVLATKPELRVCYVSAEKFMNEMIYSIQRGSTISFRTKYRGMDVLLIDDVQFLAGKESTQEEFFHTFNSLYDAHKQIVMTSDRAPKEIPTLEERLVSRFEWGLVTDIGPPDFETRVAILKRKAEDENLGIPDEVFHMIAEAIKSNIRELEGSLVKLVAFSSFAGRAITPDLAEEVLRDILSPQARTITVDDIKRVVAAHYKLAPDALVSRRRTSAIAFPRQIAMYLSRMLTDLSLSDIGMAFGKRDHTTVMHACDKVGEKTRSDPRFQALVDALADQIRQVS
jgi:chromosomal replication initiator protein